MKPSARGYVFDPHKVVECDVIMLLQDKKATTYKVIFIIGFAMVPMSKPIADIIHEILCLA